MKIAFYQAALLIGAASAAEAYEVEEASYWPDMLVQTASIVDYFFPSLEQETTTYLAEIGSSEFAEVDAEVDAEADAEADVEVDAEVEGPPPAVKKAVKAAVEKKQAVKNDVKKALGGDSDDTTSSSDSDDSSDSSSTSTANSGSESTDSSGSDSETSTDSSGDDDSSTTDSSTDSSEDEPVPSPAAGTLTKMIDGLNVTHPKCCGPQASADCCKDEKDPGAKAIEILKADAENSAE